VDELSDSPRIALARVEPAPRLQRYLPVMRASTSLPGLGARLSPAGVEVCVWAPAARSVELVVEHEPAAVHCLRAERDGYFSAQISALAAGALYRYRLDGKGPYPDPASRFQPRGPNGPSMVVDPRAHRWNDHAWRGARMHGQVIYELHVGAFTPEGTFDAAAGKLGELAALGVTLIELMPVAEFPGRWNWGYDGVQLFAPYHGYGDYDGLKRLVDAAHAQELGVILDVVYNHLGPTGNYLPCYAQSYFTDRHANEWGEALNFDGADSAPVRALFIENACHWVGEFHLDGLRLDATQSMHDAGEPHILAEIGQRARAAASPRRILLIAENEPQQVRCLAPAEHGGFGLDALWNDDFHHSARVAATGNRDGYFHDYCGSAQEFVSAARRGFLYQGQYYAWQKKPRGTPLTHEPAAALVHYLQNHDQVANTLSGMRLHAITSPALLRALTAVLLLAPQTPMLFMGQEFAASAPFPFFADHEPQLARKVHAGRREFVRQFAHYATAAAQARIPDPAAPETFQRAKLDWDERARHAPTWQLHRDLLRLRREDAVIGAQRRDRLDGAVLAEGAFVLRWFSDSGEDRLLIVNLGGELTRDAVPEPLLAPPLGACWRPLWSSEEPGYGGMGALAPFDGERWRISGASATLLAAAYRCASAAPTSGAAGAGSSR